MTKTGVLRLWFIRFVLGTQCAKAQLITPSAIAGQRAVYIIDFDSSTPQQAPVLHETNMFITTLLQLKLVGAGKFHVVRSPVVLTCVMGVSGNPTQIKRGETVDGREMYYTIRGSLAPLNNSLDESLRQTNPEALEGTVLNLELSKLVSCTPDVIFRRSGPLSRVTAFEAISGCRSARAQVCGCAFANCRFSQPAVWTIVFRAATSLPNFERPLIEDASGATEGSRE